LAVVPLARPAPTPLPGPWDQHLLTTITPAGRAARTALDPRSAMMALLRQPFLATPWCQRTNRLVLLYERPEAECHRLVMHAVSRQWVGLHLRPGGPPLALRDLLGGTGLLSDARLRVLDRRLPRGRPLRVAPIGRDLALVGWLSPADFAALRQVADLTVWYWQP
jgi:hypothetical protein